MNLRIPNFNARRRPLSLPPAAPALVRRGSGDAHAARTGSSIPASALAAIILALCVLVSAACVAAHPASNLPEPTDPAQIHGKAQYERKCALCHELYAPREFTAVQWDACVKHYAGRANLAVADRPDVLAYLHAYAADAK